jgi:hypothetical protein
MIEALRDRKICSKMLPAFRHAAFLENNVRLKTDNSFYRYLITVSEVGAGYDGGNTVEEGFRGNEAVESRDQTADSTAKAAPPSPMSQV